MSRHPPRARRTPLIVEHHGQKREDPYAWLKDENWPGVMRDPTVLHADIKRHLDAENRHCAAALEHTQPLQAELYSEFRSRIKETDASVPAPDGPFDYYVRYRADGQHPILCRRPRDGSGGELVLLDGDAAAEGFPYFHVGDQGHSPDHRLFAWTVDVTGSEIYTLRVRNLVTGTLLAEAVANCQGTFEWANDSRTIFYVGLDEHHRPCTVRRHRLGDAPADDRLIYEEPDAGFFVGVGKTRSRRYVIIASHDHVTSEVRLVDAERPEVEPILVAARTPNVEYEVGHHADRLIILTNTDGAEDFKVVEAPLARPSRAHWRDLVPHRSGTLILGQTLFERHLVTLEQTEGLPRLVVRELATGAEHTVAFDEDAYNLQLEPTHEFATPWLRYMYGSMTTPRQTFDYQMDTRERVLRKTQEIPCGHDPSAYVTRRLFATGHDGERVPISVLARADTPLDGSAPLLLYGYGAYGHSTPADFSTTRLSLVDRGFVYAIAHVRGGMELGYRWYRDGKLSRKRNTFLDFIAAAEHLAETGYASRERIAAHGRSAGGMLMGAIANLRPDLFAVIVAEVPFVDVLNTMTDETLPLTPPEWPEWGDPLRDAEAYAYIAGYSPYDNIAPEPYPHILATGGLTDPRVTYWEPAKWVARLRSTTTGDARLLLRTNMEAGHVGAAGRFERLRETALVYAFVLDLLGSVRSE
jgi:oligopeptidase B